MSFENLTKTQKQYLVIGLVVAVIALVLGWIGVRLSLTSVAQAKDELADLTEKIERADRTLKKGQYTGADFDDTVATLREYLAMAAPNQNQFSWATEKIYSIARNAAFEIDSIDEYGKTASGKPAAGAVQFDSYSIRITAHGSFEDTKRFLEHVERDHPLVRIAGLDISTGRSQETHDIQLLLQWPHHLESIVSVWDDVEKKRDMLAIKGDRPRRPEAVDPQVAQDGPQQAVAPAEPEPVAIAVSKPKPKKVVAAVEPKPEPVVEKPTPVAPKPKPEPVVAAESVPPAPVVAEPAPKIEKKAPVVAEATSPPVSVPVVEEPKPVVAAVEPKPEPKPEPVVAAESATPAPEPKPVVAEPKPPVAETEPEPTPVVVRGKPQPEPEPVVEAPTPVVRQSTVAETKADPILDPVALPDPEPEDEPEAEGSDLQALLASLDARGEEPKAEPMVDAKPDSVVEPVPPGVPETGEASSEATDGPEPEKSDLQALLASLDAHGDEQKPTVEPAIKQQDAAELEALVAQLGNKPVAESEPAPEPAAPAEAESPPQPRGGQQYSATPASNEKLAELLRKEPPKTDDSLDDFLNGLMENIND